jgi:hypothetical protein
VTKGWETKLHRQLNREAVFVAFISFAICCW